MEGARRKGGGMSDDEQSCPYVQPLCFTRSPTQPQRKGNGNPSCRTQTLKDSVKLQLLLRLGKKTKQM
ncbi:hypothetical protein EYF80_015336 [Liparis tanakae]|uniref:Uncharacterized protein n=1 Tax=Liparis tanakae TaxID=230148 RepID=A0A4Z2I8S0_9TELE|nr:hypothetical protein EYF80_015336 [Liparis tanakae]